MNPYRENAMPEEVKPYEAPWYFKAVYYGAYAFAFAFFGWSFGDTHGKQDGLREGIRAAEGTCRDEIVAVPADKKVTCSSSQHVSSIAWTGPSVGFHCSCKK
jgi:hypothetical protein